MTTRIKILLVDDFPEFCWDSVSCRPFLPKELEELFELAWIQNAAEARWVLESFEAFIAHASQPLVEAGLPPEILIFDYALSQGGTYARKRQDLTYPIPRMKRLLTRNKIAPITETPEESNPPPNKIGRA